jgi:hypothetical protein
VASGIAKRKHFALSIKKRMKLLMKLEKGASVKRLCATFGIEPEMWEIQKYDLGPKFPR